MGKTAENNNNDNRLPGPAGDRKQVVPANTVDTLSSRKEKENVGKTVGGEDYKISLCSERRFPENKPVLKTNGYKC